MKKLLMVAAIVCVASVSQAATAYWSAATANRNYIYADKTTKLSSGTAYLFWATASLDQQYVLDNYDKIGDLGGKALTVDSGVISKTSWNDTATGSTRDYFVAIVNGDNVFVSDTETGINETTVETATSIALKLQSQSKSAAEEGMTFTVGGWYSAVPEPTSGLLLLLGMAGLALRRKRA